MVLDIIFNLIPLPVPEKKVLKTDRQTDDQQSDHPMRVPFFIWSYETLKNVFAFERNIYLKM